MHLLQTDDKFRKNLSRQVFGDNLQELFTLNDEQYKLAVLELVKRALNLVEVKVGGKFTFLHTTDNSEVRTTTFIVEKINFKEPTELIYGDIITSDDFTLNVIVDGTKHSTLPYTLDKRFLYGEYTTIRSMNTVSKDKTIVRSILVSGIDISNLS